MADELGEVEDEADEDDAEKKVEGLGRLQGLVSFLPTEKPFIGFGEHHPLEGAGKDNLEAVANRRVEVMFFEQGQEPDVGILQEAPEVSELFDRQAFERAEIEGSAKPGAFVLHELVVPVVQDPDLAPLLSLAIEVRQGDTVVAKVVEGTPDVLSEKETETVFFHIRELRVGTYELFTVNENEAVCIARDITVKKKGIFFNGMELASRASHVPREELTFTDKPTSELVRALDPPNC